MTLSSVKFVNVKELDSPIQIFVQAETFFVPQAVAAKFPSVDPDRQTLPKELLTEQFSFKNDSTSEVLFKTRSILLTVLGLNFKFPHSFKEE